MNRRSVYLLAVCVLWLLGAGWGCKKNDSGNGVTGHVDVVDGSGADVEVQIFDEPTFDQNSPWPTTSTIHAVAYPYTVENGFEWRQQRSTRRDVVTTNSSGDFSAPNLPDGAYVVVARKDSFGWSVPVRVNLSGKSADAGTLRLYRDHPISPSYTIRQDTVWNPGSHIVLQGNLSIAATLTIRPGVVVRLKDDSWIRVLSGGTLVSRGTADSTIIFTSDLLIPNYTDWRSIRFDAGASPPNFEHCTFRYSESGVESNTPGGIIQSCFFYLMSAYGVNLTGVGAGADDSLVVRRCVFQHIPYAIRAVQVLHTPLLVEHNAVFGSRVYGTDLEVIRGGRAYCNWYYDCGGGDTTLSQPTGGLYVRDVRELIIERNEFNSSPVGLSVSSRVDSSTMVQYNKFSSCSRSVQIGYAPGLEGAAYPSFQYNCFNRGGRYNLYIAACSVNNHNIEAENNYWGTASDSEILDFFWEHGDEGRCPYVNYIPFLTQCPSGQAGICGS